MDYSMIPAHCRTGVKEYIEHGKPMGNFLTEVFSNNLVQALFRADDTNVSHMRDYASFLYNEAPHGCWGSAALVADWEGLVAKTHRLMEEGRQKIKEATE